MASIEEVLLGEDPRSSDSPKGFVQEDRRLEVALEGRTSLKKVGPSVQQRVLPTEVLLQEAHCHTEDRGALEASTTERHCHTGMAVAPVEQGPSSQAALVPSLGHIGHPRHQGMTALLGEHNLKAAIQEDTGRWLTTHPLSPWFQSATEGNQPTTC